MVAIYMTDYLGMIKLTLSTVPMRNRFYKCKNSCPAKSSCP
jgi:hypothetical protein